MKKIIALVLSLCMILSLSTAFAFAASSPQGNKKYTVTIIRGDDSSDKDIEIVEEGDNLRITSKFSEDSYIFVSWVIEGEYDVISGSEDEKVIVVKPYSDLTVQQILEPIDESEDEPSPEKPQKPGATNDDDVSPPTGQSNLIFIILGAVFAGGFVTSIIAKKRIK